MKPDGAGRLAAPVDVAALRELVSFVGALCLFLSVVEYMLPKPPPLFFFRLGLANIPILVALPWLDFHRLCLVVFLKVVGQGLLNGTLASYVFLFSAGGSLASGLVMWLLYHLLHDRISLVGLSVAGALSSNLVQVILSVSFIFGPAAWPMAPLFMGLGLASGLATGFFALAFVRRSRWHASFGPMALACARGHGGFILPVQEPDPFRSAGRSGSQGSAPSPRRWRVPATWDLLGRWLEPQVLFWWGLALIPLFLLQTSFEWRLVQTVFLALLGIAGGKRLRPLYFTFLVAGITFFGLVVPRGKVVLDLAGFHITEGALLGGLYKGTGIAGLVFISLATVRRDLILPGHLGALLGRMFRYNELLMTQRSPIRLQGLVGSIDAALYAVGALGAPQQVVRGTGKDRNRPLRERVRGIGLLGLYSLPFLLPLAWQLAGS